MNLQTIFPQSGPGFGRRSPTFADAAKGTTAASVVVTAASEKTPSHCGASWTDNGQLITIRCIPQNYDGFFTGGRDYHAAAVVPFAASAKVGDLRPSGALTAEDRLEIHELYARYAWALGTGDTESFVACVLQATRFTPRTYLRKRIAGWVLPRFAPRSNRFRRARIPGHQHMRAYRD